MRQEHIVSDDQTTVKKHSQIMRFAILNNKNQIAKIQMSSQQTTADLLTAVKKIISKKYGIVIGLSSTVGNEVINYALTLKQYPLYNFKNNQSFALIVRPVLSVKDGISIKHFMFMKCLGQGGSASVYLVRHLITGMIYALKQIDKDYFVDFKKMEQVLREKKIMTHNLSTFQFATKLYAAFESETHLNLLMEFYPGGQLFFHLQRQRFNEGQAKIYFAEIVTAVQFLHNQKIVYRDLKPENIMIDLYGHAILADFGLCKINFGKQDFTVSYCGSIEYMAPEVKKSIAYNYSVDFYTLGALLFEMVTGIPPYYNNQPLIIPKEASIQFMQLVKKLIEPDMKKRISNFNMIKNSKWLKNIDWLKIQQRKYQMSVKINPYCSYIHEQFKNVQVDQINLREEKKYDKLFDMFYYLRENDQRGLEGAYNMGKNENGMKISSSVSLKKKLKKNNLNKSSKNIKIKKSKQPNETIYTKKISPNKVVYHNKNVNLFSSNSKSKSKYKIDKSWLIKKNPQIISKYKTKQLIIRVVKAGQSFENIQSVNSMASAISAVSQHRSHLK